MHIADQVNRCNCLVDVGTDHGYIPIHLLKQEKCNKVIATDINIGPVEKAKFNISVEELEDKVEFRLGSGLSIIRPGEVEVIIIAGMGGNLIRDIIEEGLEVIKKADYIVLQPVQNPEILRKYLIEKGFKILDEDICLEDNKYYEIIKVTFDNKPDVREEIFYEISEKLIKENHPLISGYIKNKIFKYNKINDNIIDGTPSALARKRELVAKIQRLEELLRCL